MKRGPLLALALVVLTGAGLHFSGLPARAAEAMGIGKVAQPDLGLTGQFTRAVGRGAPRRAGSNGSRWMASRCRLPPMAG